MKNQILFTATLLFCLFNTSSHASNTAIDLIKDSIHLNLNEYKSGGPATFASVGAAADTNCDFTSIQAAINSGVDEVRISRFVTFLENITIENKSISLIGGYGGCLSANTNGIPTSNNSTIDASGSGTVISVINDANSYDINIANLRVINGSFAFLAGTGGIYLSGTGTRVTIDRIEIEENLGSAITANDIDTLGLKDAYISNNTNINGNGGGIYCNHTFITMYGRSTIRGNTANLGGGVFATNQCSFTQFSGQPALRSGSNGVLSNTATLNGGGIYADQGSTINLYGHSVDFGSGEILGDSTRASYIGSNGSENGAGMYLDGTNTSANLSGFFIGNNTASAHGGGIYLTNNAQLAAVRYDLPCRSSTRCNEFNNNKSGTGITGGGAIFATNSSQFGLGNNYFTHNTAGVGSAIFATTNVNGTIESSIFTNNNGHSGRLGVYVISFEDSSNLDLGFNTFVDNLSNTSILSLSDSHITNVGNIFYEYPSGSVLALLASTATNYCILSRDTLGLTGSNISQLTLDPFVDRGALNFHLDEISGGIAMDRCDTITYAPSTKDMDQEPRGIDIPLTNVNGAYDVGADEFFIEELFMDGFE